MAAEVNSWRIVIAGGSSLLGGELKTLLEASRFAGWDLRLVDEENVAGTLTVAGGEAGGVQRGGGGPVSRGAVCVSGGFHGVWETLPGSGAQGWGHDY